jgi:hypothetical protein
VRKNRRNSPLLRTSADLGQAKSPKHLSPHLHHPGLGGRRLFPQVESRNAIHEVGRLVAVDCCCFLPNPYPSLWLLYAFFIALCLGYSCEPRRSTSGAACPSIWGGWLRSRSLVRFTIGNAARPENGRYPRCGPRRSHKFDLRLSRSVSPAARTSSGLRQLPSPTPPGRCG